MGSTQSYLAMMTDSLDKKIELLKKIEEENVKQREALTKQGGPDIDAFDAAVDAKGDIIEELDQLNAGFETLFAQVKAEVDQNRAKYKTEITALQEKIRTITALSTSIQAEEERNKKLVEQTFADARKDIMQGKKSAKAALDYYHSMARSTFTPPQFIDSKH
ncbi:MAG: flagellar export chaperone FlgN [Lachnospiraceae bacterium]|nr:flagellar export chaperone FlgN [Lachnospiraceae bacterium]